MLQDRPPRHVIDGIGVALVASKRDLHNRLVPRSCDPGVGKKLRNGTDALPLVWGGTLRRRRRNPATLVAYVLGVPMHVG